ncbi:hypothetical protein BO78DRAFT_73662 [Aspergillus sclerotiicarbonarius CBS 121057]|uniref:Uncharacterized protein n=1 Tax=Aspergillus sclerotiicarbonarius (strain CBS 121057 / IBT 28362) TaxID=1448318 RepID=A0A319EG67_ASPSB|nr:hypothetical protein BO78DRAFT_73662 [Aspergillus sclerotiicarbonarius CBS 121057]
MRYGCRDPFQAPDPKPGNSNLLFNSRALTNPAYDSVAGPCRNHVFDSSGGGLSLVRTQFHLTARLYFCQTAMLILAAGWATPPPPLPW